MNQNCGMIRKNLFIILGLGTEDGQEELEGYEEGVANTCIYRSIREGSTKQITQTVTKLLEQSLKR